MNNFARIFKRKTTVLLSTIAMCMCSALICPTFSAEAASKVNTSALASNKSYTSIAEKSILTTEEIGDVDSAETVLTVEAEDSHPYYAVNTSSGKRTLNAEYQDHTYQMCVKYGIEQYYNLILTQMYCESSYNPNAVSSARCYGLMQVGSVHSSYLRNAIGVTDIRDPYQNIEAGVFIMAGLIQKYGDAQAALVCYHRGERAARQGIRSDSYSTHIVNLSSTLVEA